MIRALLVELLASAAHTAGGATAAGYLGITDKQWRTASDKEWQIDYRR